MLRNPFRILMLLLAIAPVAPAETIQGLLDAGTLQARALVQSPAPHYQKAPIEIVVEVGTPDRFADGTRVRDFTVPGTLVRRMTTSAFNETRREGGTSWSFQSWRFNVHSERPGILTLPALRTFISVETGTDGVVEGEVELALPPVQVEVAPGTEGLDSWVAAETFEVEESWEGSLESYQIGDAVTRVRTFTITGSPAMAIPASPEIELKGVEVYQAPARVNDQAVGGALQGEREERVVFTFKGGGSHGVPDDHIDWFNLTTGEVERVDLPGRRLEVEGPVARGAASAPEPEREPGNPWVWGLILLGGGLCYGVVRWIIRSAWLRRLRAHLEVLRQHRRARVAYLQAAERQDSRGCLELLYARMSEQAEWQLGAACADDPRLSAAAAALMANAYSGGPAPEASELRLLWEACTTPKPLQRPQNSLRLNPGPGTARLG